jgi:WD40 repeat protein/uncharacterized caspase-like protein
MSARSKLSRVMLHFLLLAAFPFVACGSVPAQDKLKVEVVPQVGHSLSVTSVAFSADGRNVLSGNYDNTAKLWDLASGKLVRTFEGHSRKVNSVVFSPDGRTALSGSDDQTVKLWDLATGKLVRTFEGHAKEVTSVAFSPDGRTALSGSTDGTVKLWDVATGNLVRTFKGHSSFVHSVAFSPDGRTVLLGGGNVPPNLSRGRTGKLELWDVAAGALLRTFESHSKSVAFSPDGRSVLSGGDDQTVKLWDVVTGKLVRTFEGHSGEVYSVAFSPDGRTALSGSARRHDGTIKLWDVATGSLVRTFVAHSDGVLSIALSPDGRAVLSGGFGDSTIKLWDVATGNLVRAFEGHSDRVFSIALSRDGRAMLSGGDDNTLKLWNVPTGKPVRAFEGHSDTVYSVAFSPDDRTALSGSRDFTVKLWDVATGKLLRTFETKSGSVKSVAFSPNGRTVLSGSDGGTIKLWDVATGKLVRTFKADSVSVQSLAFSPDGRTILSCGFDQSFKLWNVATGKLVRTFETKSGPVNSVAFSLNGRAMLSGSLDKTLKLWDVATGKLVRTFAGHLGAVYSVAFSRDERTALSGSGDHTIKLWDVATGKLMRTLEGHSGAVHSVAFSRDERTVLSGSWDGSVRVWSLSSGTDVVRLLASQEGDWVAMTPAGFFDLGGDVDKLLHLVRGLDVLSVGQTFEQLYRPDLVEAALKGDPQGKYADEAYRLNLEAILDSGPAPQIEHLAERDDRAGDTIRLSLRITGTGGGVSSRIVWKVNGVTQGNTTPPALAAVDGPLGSAVVSETLRLVPGQANEIEVTAYNYAGLVATPPFKIMIDQFGTTTAERPRMFVLALGVNKYRMKDYQLSYAVTDATTFARALTVVGSTLFAEVKTIALTDEQVTEAGVSFAIDSIARDAKPEDVFVLFLGGHGSSIAGRYYYYPQTLDFTAHQSVQQNAIGQDKWEAWLAKITVQKSLLIIDTCEGDAFRGSRGTDTVRQTAMTQLQRATGRNVISAARDAAYEGYNGHGVLTYALLEALDIKAARVEDERVRVNSLADYVEQRVPQITRERFGFEQLPTRKLSGNDFPIGIRQAVLEVGEQGPPIAKEPTHVVIRAVLAREKASSEAPGSRQFEPGTQVRVLEFFGSWVLVAREGQKVGYVPADALARIQ